MSNQAKQIDEGIEAMGERLSIPRVGFRSNRPEKAFLLRKVAEEGAPQVSKAQPIEVEAPKPARTKPFDRITFEITPAQRAELTNIATTINFRVPREKRAQKINRDMLMRAILSVAESIDWTKASGLSSEEDIKNFVSAQLAIYKKTTDKEGAN